MLMAHPSSKHFISFPVPSNVRAPARSDGVSFSYAGSCYAGSIGLRVLSCPSRTAAPDLRAHGPRHELQLTRSALPLTTPLQRS